MPTVLSKFLEEKPWEFNVNLENLHKHIPRDRKLRGAKDKLIKRVLKEDLNYFLCKSSCELAVS